MSDHLTRMSNAGTLHGWYCDTCGATSRHLLPYYKAVRNARAHETKAAREDEENPCTTTR